MDKPKEKLAELINDILNYLPWGQVSNHTAEEIADHLIANGVTVQRWIPVTERLPDEAPNSEGGSSSELVLVVVEDSLGSRFVADDITVHGGEWVNFPFPEWEVTHWMPLPEPPKEVE